jgi:glycosyltransferase involved in cell wall biosynthesis
MAKILSIIIPVYKVERYIRKCLDSLILPENLLQRMEVLIVNDGTPDNSAVIAKEYEQNYPETFRVIDKENGGHGSAWNVGLKSATGRYVKFLDSDDWLENLDRLVERLSNTDADIVFNPKVHYYLDTNFSEVISSFGCLEQNKIYDAEKFDWMQFGYSMDITNFQYCTYKRDILQPFEPLFLEHQCYDDSILFIVPIVAGHQFVYFDFPVYHYLLGRQGQTADRQAIIKHYKDKENVKKQIIDFYLHHNNLPNGKQKKIDALMRTIVWRHYELLLCLDDKKGKKESRNWHRFVKEKCPQFQQGWRCQLYNLLPYRLFKKIFGK